MDVKIFTNKKQYNVPFLQITLLLISGHPKEVLKLNIFGIGWGEGTSHALGIAFQGKPKKRHPK